MWPSSGAISPKVTRQRPKPTTLCGETQANEEADVNAHGRWHFRTPLSHTPEPTSDGLHPSSDGLQPASEGLGPPFY